MNMSRHLQTCWSIRDSLVGGSTLWCSGGGKSESHLGAIVTLGCPAKPHTVFQIFQTNNLTIKWCFYFCDWSRQFLPVCMCGASPNKSLTTARALSERASTSFNSSWSENTCRSKTTSSSSSLPINQKQKTLSKRLIGPQTSLMMLRLAWSKGAGLLICLNRHFKAFSFSSHWAAALLWDLWISRRWFWWRNMFNCLIT